MIGSERLQLIVEGAEDLVVELGAEDLAAEEGRHGSAAPRVSPPLVRRLAPTRADLAAGRRRFEVSVDGWVFQVTAASAARAALIERAGRGSGQTGGHAAQSSVRAQIPGRVVRLWVAQGDEVEKGQRLLAVEAMKMENEVRSPRAGTVSRVAVAVGTGVELGDELVVVG